MENMKSSSKTNYFFIYNLVLAQVGKHTFMNIMQYEQRHFKPIKSWKRSKFTNYQL